MASLWDPVSPDALRLMISSRLRAASTETDADVPSGMRVLSTATLTMGVSLSAGTTTDSSVLIMAGEFAGSMRLTVRVSSISGMSSSVTETTTSKPAFPAEKMTASGSTAICSSSETDRATATVLAPESCGAMLSRTVELSPSSTVIVPSSKPTDARLRLSEARAEGRYDGA